MYRIIFYFLLTLFFVSYIFAGSIQGVVRNSVSLSPMSNIDVSLHVIIPDSIAYYTVSDMSGKYKFTGVVPHNKIYVIIANKNGYKQSYTRVDQLGSQDLVYDILLEPDTVNIPPGGGGDSSFVDGYILEPVHGGDYNPVQNAKISLFSYGGNLIALSDVEGKYKVKVPIGLYVITVTATGFDSLSTSDLQVDTIGLTHNAILHRNSLAVDDYNLSLPNSFALSQAYPNPFNPVTKIEYQLPVECRVKLTVNNLLGQSVNTLIDRTESAGFKTAIWNAFDINSGIYFYRLEAVAVNDPSVTFVQVKRAVLIK
jgi:hypothetical protein